MSATHGRVIVAHRLRLERMATDFSDQTEMFTKTILRRADFVFREGAT
jgi:hypothetical protein